MYKEIFINILLIVITLGIVEYHSFSLTKAENEAFKKQTDRMEANNTAAFKTSYKILEDFEPTFYRNSFLKDTDKKPIIWFGCSFAEGAGLEDVDTPCYKISEKTGRSCLNRAKGATGTQYMYWQLLQQDFKQNNPEPEYVIYTFIWNHLHRLYNYQVNPLIYMFNLRYKYENNELKEIKPFFKPLYSSYFVKRVLNNNANKAISAEEQNFALFNVMMKATAQKVKELYPNTKFIFIEFPEQGKKFLPDWEIEQLQSYGIQVIRVKELLGDVDIYEDKYWLPDNIHPTSEAWDLVFEKIDIN